jgi:hypothetical protein
MTTSGTYNFNPSLGEIVIDAFNMCGIRPSSLLQEHMQSARLAVNYLLGRWSSQGVNLWQVDLQTVSLVAGQGTYSVPANTIVMLDAYLVPSDGIGNRIILPISRTEYASYPNPLQQGAITVFWFDRLLTSPQFSLYYVPDGTVPTLQYYRLRQTQDANFTDGQQVEVPYYWLEALGLGLAQRLAIRWAPMLAPGLKGLADEAYQIAADQNVETSQFFISPQVGGYFRP